MKLLFKNHVPIANKWLIVFSGLNKNANKNGKKQYEQHDFHIPKEWLSIKWTRSLISQTLCYLSLADSKGSVGVVSIEDIATTISCSVRTVKDNDSQLVKLGLIQKERLWGEFVNIRFVNYKENFLDLYQDLNGQVVNGKVNDILSEEDRDIPHYSRTGYTMIKKESLFELFKIKNVNELKIACRALYIYEIEVNVGGNDSAHMTYNDFKGILPKYYAFKFNIKKGFAALKKLFSYKPLEKQHVIQGLLTNQKVTPTLLQKLKNTFVISFNLLKERDSRYIHKRETNKAFDYFYSFCQTTNINHIPSFQQSVLVREFGLPVVKAALTEMLELFQQGYSSTRSAMVDGIDSEPIQTLRKFMKKHYEGKIDLF